MESIRSTFQTSSEARRVIFFDGECNLCNQWVDFLLRLLKRRSKESTHFSFQLASLQGKTAQSIFASAGRLDLIKPPYTSVVLYQRVAGTVSESEFFTESESLLRIFSELEFPWSLLRAFRVIPSFIRDSIYRWIARNRIGWFGRRATCRVPTLQEKAYFLD